MSRRLVRTIAVPVTDNTVTEQLADAIAAMEQMDKKLVPPAMRQWLLAGFQLAQIEHGIIDGWVGLGVGGQMNHFSSRQKADVLKNLIERTMWFEDMLPAVKSASEPLEQVVSVPVEKVNKVVKTPATGVAGIPADFDLQDL